MTKETIWAPTVQSLLNINDKTLKVHFKHQSHSKAEKCDEEV